MPNKLVFKRKESIDLRTSEAGFSTLTLYDAETILRELPAAVEELRQELLDDALDRRKKAEDDIRKYSKRGK